jgi:multidrug efflux pump subunit AcrA (membrane-fusion protein)
MTAVLKIANYSKSNAIIIPMKAIQNSEAGNYVFINDKGFAKRKNIQQGATSGGQTEIISGINPGDQVVVEGAGDIEEGDKLQVSQQ